MTTMRCRSTPSPATNAASSWFWVRQVLCRPFSAIPRYFADWRDADPTPSGGPPSFPVREQSRSDGGAAAWGLLAWEDPDGGDDMSSPFWTDLPMLEAESAPPDAPGVPALRSLLREAEARLSGLRLNGGAMVLKIERGGDAVQVRVADGNAFDPGCGLVLRQGVGLNLPVNLVHARDLWAFFGGRVKKARVLAAGWIKASCFAPSMAPLPASPIAA